MRNGTLLPEKEHMKTILICLVASLAGCATSSTIAPYGKDTYVLNVADTMGTRQKSELRIRAAQDAHNHCSRLGKQLKVRSAEDRGISWLTSTSSQIIFSCEAEVSAQK